MYTGRGPVTLDHVHQTPLLLPLSENAGGTSFRLPVRALKPPPFRLVAARPRRARGQDKGDKGETEGECKRQNYVAQRNTIKWDGGIYGMSPASDGWP